MQYFLTTFNSILLTHDNKTRIEIILKILFLDALFSFVFISILTGSGGIDFTAQAFYTNITNNIIPIIPVMIGWIFFEELTARGPISLFINKKISLLIKIGLIFSLSLAFSFLHLPSFGFWEVLIIIPPIFVGAITYSMIYILAGANKGKIVIPLVTVTLIHLVWDIITFTLFGAPPSV